MKDLLKRTILAGIGATVVTKEALEKVLGELVEKGRISAQEANQMAEKISEEGRREFERTRQDLSDWMEEWMKKAPLVRREELTALAARVQALENELATHARSAGAHQTAEPPPQQASN